MRNITRRLLTAVTVGLVAALPLAFVLSGPANANTLTSSDGYTALSTMGTVTTGTPYSSGQQINVVVSENPTLNLTNLEANGYTGEPHMVAEECDDPGGTTAGLPAIPTNNCDSQTILSTTAVNSDGSFQFSSTNTTPNPYTVYWLPDNATFGEPSTNLPTCGTAPNFCVLYLGPDQTNFAKPHLWSAPFLVTNNGDDGGEDPGDGTPEAPLAIGLPLLGLAVGGSTLYLRRRRRSHAA